MAAGGGGSANESDFLYDFPCSPCEKDGRNEEAIKYCTDCNENLCVTCFTVHSKLAVTRGHKVLDQVQTSQGQTKQLPSQRCNKHGGKVIDVFCPEHDTVGCPTCISVDHSSCKGKTYIPDVAAGFRTSQELKHLETEINTLMAKLDSLKKLKGDNMQRLKQDKDALKKQIQSVRKKMNEQLDKMEKMLIDESEAKFRLKIDAIQASIADVDSMLSRVKRYMDNMKRDSNDANVFVSCKILKQEMSNNMYPLHKRVKKRLPERSFELHANENTKLIMEGKQMFASIQQKYTIHGAVHKGDINVSIREDGLSCAVSAICALPNGCLAMADYNNKKLKKLDPDANKVSTLIDLPDNPSYLCLVDNTCLAVPLFNQKKIQFITLSGQVKLGNSFSVGYRCRSVAHCDGMLYVGCGGSPVRNEGRGHVEVYNCKGEILRYLYEEIGQPDYISVINDGFKIAVYIGDHYKGVEERGSDGSVKHRFPTDQNTNVPFCVIGTDQLCIGEYSTGNIYIQTYKGKLRLIENVKGGPFCVYFDQKSSRLYVGQQDGNFVQVFDLNIT